MVALFRLGVGDIDKVLTFPADFGIQLLMRAAGPAVRKQERESGDPQWQTRADGSRTMRITSMEDLYRVFPKSTDADKGLRV